MNRCFSRAYIPEWTSVSMDRAATLNMISSWLPEPILAESRCALKGWTTLLWLPAGDLELTLGKTALRESAPIAWQEIDGTKKAVEVRWKILGNAKVGIVLGEYDHSQPVTIDPVLVYSTHLGGTTGEDFSVGSTFPADTFILNVGLDAQRNVYVTGTTSAIDYPTTAGAFDRTSNEQTVFHEDTTSPERFCLEFDPTAES